MHASQGFDYAFPNLADPIFVSKLILEDDVGRPAMAALARLTCEMYLLVDREGRADRDATCSAGFQPASLANTSASEIDTQDAHATSRGFRAGNPRERYAQLLALYRAVEQDLLARGLDDAHAWLPPPIAHRFGRRLESLGWVRDDAWTPYCRRLKISG